jgi:hypothetical protein
VIVFAFTETPSGASLPNLFAVTVPSTMSTPLMSATANVPNATMLSSSFNAAAEPSTMLSPLDAV